MPTSAEPDSLKSIEEKAKEEDAATGNVITGNEASVFPKLLKAVFVIAIIWWSLLVWLSFTQANSPILNRIQLQNATDVVSVRIEDRASGEVTVVSTYYGTLNSGDSLLIGNLSKANALDAETVIIPITQISSGQYKVTSCPTLEGSAPLLKIYPTTTELEQKLKKLLEKIKTK